MRLFGPDRVFLARSPGTGRTPCYAPLETCSPAPAVPRIGASGEEDIHNGALVPRSTAPRRPSGAEKRATACRIVRARHRGAATRPLPSRIRGSSWPCRTTRPRARPATATRSPPLRQRW